MSTQGIAFSKMSGAGNDFIVIDNRDGRIGEDGRKELFRAWCRRRLGVGADGVLLVEPPAGAGADFRMRYYNADGGEAESCGNGARCIAAFANSIGAAGDPLSFETLAGLYGATMTRGGVILSLTDPHSLRRDVPLPLEGIAEGKVDLIDTGVPHLVTFVEDLAGVEVDRLGRTIREHEAFAPEGVNVNFARVLEGGRLAMRTYERGVEAETLACGTGAVACAIIAHLRGSARSPVEVETTGGSVLRIHFDGGGDQGSGSVSNVRLEGEARVVYEGVLAPAPSAALARL